jgi:porphobilinogen synthase
MTTHNLLRTLLTGFFLLNQLSSNDLIYPLFVIEGENKKEAVASMPGVERLSIDLLVAEAKRV